MSPRRPRKAGRPQKAKPRSLLEVKKWIHELVRERGVGSVAPEELVETCPAPPPAMAEFLRVYNDEVARLNAAFGEEPPPPTTLSSLEEGRQASFVGYWKLICERLNLPGDPACTQPSPLLLRILCHNVKVNHATLQVPPWEKALLLVLADGLLRLCPVKHSQEGVAGGLAQALVERGGKSPPQAHKAVAQLFGSGPEAVRKSRERHKKSLTPDPTNPPAMTIPPSDKITP